MHCLYKNCCTGLRNIRTGCSFGQLKTNDLVLTDRIFIYRGDMQHRRHAQKVQSPGKMAYEPTVLYISLFTSGRMSDSQLYLLCQQPSRYQMLGELIDGIKIRVFICQNFSSSPGKNYSCPVLQCCQCSCNLSFFLLFFLLLCFLWLALPNGITDQGQDKIRQQIPQGQQIPNLSFEK